MTSRVDDLNRFYLLLDELEIACGGKRILETSARSSGWPTRGVYFFFEEGEVREDGRTLRVVRLAPTDCGRRRAPCGVGCRSTRVSLAEACLAEGTTGLSISSCMWARPSWARRNGSEAVRASWSVGSNCDQGANEWPSTRWSSPSVSGFEQCQCYGWMSRTSQVSGAIEESSNVDYRTTEAISNEVPSTPLRHAWLGRSSVREKIKGSGLWNVITWRRLRPRIG